MTSTVDSSNSKENEEEFFAAASAIGNLAQDVAYLWRRLPFPVIAVLHGMCYGGGTSKSHVYSLFFFLVLGWILPFQP